MPISKEVLMHGVAVALVAAHLFGGPRPWVSKSTAVTVAIVQGVNALALMAARPFRQRLEAKQQKVCSDEVPPPPVAAAFDALRALAARCPRPSRARGEAALRLAAGGCVILALARAVKLGGALTKPQHAVLPALVLAIGARLLVGKAAARGSWAEQDSADEIEPELPDSEDEHFDPAEDPYHSSFWEDVTERQAVERPPSTEQICADMYLRCVLRT